MSEQINIGLSKILRGSLPEYGFSDLSKGLKAVKSFDPQESYLIDSEISVPAHTDKFIAEEPKITYQVISEDQPAKPENIDELLSPLEQAHKDHDWSRLSEIAESSMNLNSQDCIAKSYWSFSALKLATLRADLVGFGLISIWQDELPNLSDEEQSNVTKILIPTSKLAVEKCSEIDPELAAKLAAFIPKSIISPEKKSILPEVPEFIDTPQLAELVSEPSELDQFQKYLNSLNIDAASNLKVEIEDSYEPELEQELQEPNSVKRINRSGLIIISLFVSLIGVSIYFYRPEETPISLVSDPSFVQESLDQVIERPKMVIKSNSTPIPDTESPLAKIIDDLENPDPAISSKKPNLEELVKPQGLNLTGPIEPEELSDILDGHIPEDAPISVKEASIEQGNNVMDDHLRDRPIVDERVNQARPKPVSFQTYQVRVMVDTSMYIKPSKFEAEIMPLYYGDRLLVLEDHGDWLKVDAFGRLVGYVKKIQYVDLEYSNNFYYYAVCNKLGIKHYFFNKKYNFNLANRQNTRKLFIQEQKLETLILLNQNHTDVFLEFDQSELLGLSDNTWQTPADALIVKNIRRFTNIGLGVMTADCLPILIYSPKAVAVIHSGWQGLQVEITNKVLTRLMELGVNNPLILIGPHAGKDCYEFQEKELALIGPNAAYLQCNGRYYLNMVDPS